MAWVKVPPENHPIFLAALPNDSRVETLKMSAEMPAKAAKADRSRAKGKATPVRPAAKKSAPKKR